MNFIRVWILNPLEPASGIGGFGVWPPFLGLGRTVLRGLVFGTLFSPHFGVQRTSNDAEAYVWPKSDTRRAQQKLRLNLA